MQNIYMFTFKYYTLKTRKKFQKKTQKNLSKLKLKLIYTPPREFKNIKYMTIIKCINNVNIAFQKSNIKRRHI